MTENLKSGGRPSLPYRINWHSRAKEVWQHFPEARKDLSKLLKDAAAANSDIVGDEYAARLKMNGRRNASDAFAKALFDATGLNGLGITLNDWIAGDAAWNEAIAELPAIDPCRRLDTMAQGAKLEFAIKSTPSINSTRIRRASSIPSPTNKAHINEYFVIDVKYVGSETLSSAHLLLIEWSAESSDWQIFNAIPGCRLDTRKTHHFTTTGAEASVNIHLGVRVVPPRSEFDLYLLAQRSEFDHRALALIDALDANAIMTPQNMAKLLGLLTRPDRGLLVSKLRYSVQ